ncbi:PREDICTED: uncharacterized protein LOC105149546 [Acromyrmex echinatior]|uniref:uncharacterized protein LOC105149546 n=1 Tax=Acromyrmex echinatior TaxID=103372 RepID=UPI000580C4DA|nr:PREDICTED: uncharacterized protein LOC105149546 [Acromyrmex echinatior]
MVSLSLIWTSGTSKRVKSIELIGTGITYPSNEWKISLTARHPYSPSTTISSMVKRQNRGTRASGCRVISPVHPPTPRTPNLPESSSPSIAVVATRRRRICQNRLEVSLAVTIGDDVMVALASQVECEKPEDRWES